MNSAKSDIGHASAPGKVILFGEHFVVHGTSAITCAINRRITAHCETIPENRILVESRMGNIAIPPDAKSSEIPREQMPVVYLAQKYLGRTKNPGVKITIESDIPPGVGLGSSSACCAAISGALQRLEYPNDSPDHKMIIKDAVAAEQTVFDDISGADTAASVHGGIMQYNRESRTGIKPGTMPDIIIANSGIPHDTPSLVAKVAGFRNAHKSEFSDLCEKMEKLVSDARIALERSSPDTLGRLMRKNQEYLSRIGVSSPALDSIMSITDAAALGSKITGAGGGGCIICVADESKTDTLLRNLWENEIECFVAGTDYLGLQVF